MFCKNCGKEVKEQWNVCPYCKSKIKDQYEEQNDNTNIENSDSIGETDLKEEKDVDDEKNKGTEPVLSLKKIMFWKFLLFGFITFGIYALYTMWRFTKSINQLCEGEGKKSPNYFIVIFLSVVTFGIYGLYWVYSQGKRLYEISPKYYAEVKQNGMTYVLWKLFLPGIGELITAYLLFRNYNKMIDNYNNNCSRIGVEKKQKITLIQKILFLIFLLINIFFWWLFYLGLSSPAEDITEKSETVKVSNEDKKTKSSEKKDVDQKEEKEKKKQEKEIIISINDLVNHSDQYLNQQVIVEGYYEGPSESTYYLHDSEDNLYLALLEVEGIEFFETCTNKTKVNVRGKVCLNGTELVLQVKEYEILEEMPNEQNSSPQGITFEDRKAAAERYSALNWNQFFLNPTSLSDMGYCYFPGNIIDIDCSDGLTYGLIEMADDDSNTIVQFSISSEEYGLYKGDFVSFLGTVAGYEGSYSDANGNLRSCPLINVEEFLTDSQSITLEGLSESEKEFIYGQYENTDGYYDRIPGERFEFTEGTIGGYKYTLDHITMTCGTVLMASYDVHANNMSIIYYINVDVPGEPEKKEVVINFYLDGKVSVSYDGGTTNEYLRVS